MKFDEPNRNCPCCQLQVYPALQGHERTDAHDVRKRFGAICGNGPLDLSLWQGRLDGVLPNVKANPYLLRAETPGGERLVLFADGRVLVQGTDDFSRARTLYDRYVGT